jgi:hypothetical protein
MKDLMLSKKSSNFIWERQRILYGIQYVLRIFWQTWIHILMHIFFSVHCKHVQCNTLIFTPSTNADLLNIKRKGDPKSRTLSRTSDIIETRNPCVIKVIVLACSTYIDIFWNFIKTRLTYWQESFFFVEVNSNNTAPSIGNIAKPLKKHVPDISRPKKSRHYFDALDEREIGR